MKRMAVVHSRVAAVVLGVGGEQDVPGDRSGGGRAR